MKYTNLSSLGYGSNIQYSSESYLLHTRALDEQMSKAYAEGIFGAASTAARTVGRGVRDGVQMGKAGLKKLWAIIKKVLNGFMNMLQQMWIDIGNNQGRMQDLVITLQGLITQLQKDSVTESMKQDETVDSYTIRTFNLAGWNLSFGNDQQSDDLDDIFKRILQRKDDASINETKSNITDSIGTVAFFVRLMALRNDGVAPEDAFTNIKNIDGLYQALNVLFKEAYNIYNTNGDYANYLGWGNQTKLWAQDTLNNKDSYIYQAFKPTDYGKYVAQAFSPAGAFVTLNKESFNQSSRRIDAIKKKLTPVKEEDIPSANCQQEFTRACNYLLILFQTLIRLDIIDSLKQRAKKLNKILQKVQELEKTTGQDVAVSNIAQNDLAKRNYKYGQLKINDDGTISENQDFEQGGQGDNQGESESFGLENDLLAIQDAMNAYSEDGVPGGVDFNEYSKISGVLQNNDTSDAVRKAYIDSSYTGVQSANYNSAFKSHSVNIKKSDLTGEGIVNGIKYLHQYLIAAGNLCFQEGRFFNIMTKIMCDTAKEFVGIVNEWLTPAHDEEDNNYDNANAIRFSDGYNANVGNKQYSDATRSAQLMQKVSSGKNNNGG